eukprot:GEMP01026102.1.p1 GENE.GEMP01026102.1~~GEMP01026102.1.p1  ORF type:complete len:319 (+),score=47.10 GEMP01026102.1:291-1247(+)
MNDNRVEFGSVRSISSTSVVTQVSRTKNGTSALSLTQQTATSSASGAAPKIRGSDTTSGKTKDRSKSGEYISGSSALHNAQAQGAKDDNVDKKRPASGSMSQIQKQGTDKDRGAAAGSSSASTAVPRPAMSTAPSAYDTYSFFAKYTYSSECALLGYNFHTIVSQLGIFEFISYPHDYRLISVTLAYIFYKYKIHHCDMALDLALTLIYLEELSVPTLLGFENNDAFNVVCYFAFLAHVYNADRTIRLTDWYKEMNRAGAPRAFESCREANKFVWYLFNDVRGLRLMPNEQRVKKYIQRLCAAPQLHPPSSSRSGRTG